MADANFHPSLQVLHARARRGDTSLIADVVALCSQFPAEVEAWRLLACVHQRSGDQWAALSALTKANALVPQKIAIALELGVMQFGLGNSTAAASTLDRALAFHPGDVPLLFHRAYLHETAGAASSAETLYRRALDSDPRHADSLANLGVLLTRNGRHSEVWKAAHRFRVGKFSRAHDHPLFQELVERHRSESFRHPCLARRSEDGRRDRCDRDRRRFFYRGLVEPVQIAESIRAALLDVLVLLEVGMRCMSARRLRPLTEPCCAVAEAPRWQTLLALLTLVASDAADCVARAAAVLADRDRLRDLSERTRAATPFLFENDRPIVALNELMQTLAEQARERGID